ncbi:hypothetical protein [Streptomyces canus]|uniref:hypothetical protein n=1 Tax=Streptomyces canus TaxID=58343 RepID=UPI0030E103C6
MLVIPLQTPEIHHAGRPITSVRPHHWRPARICCPLPAARRTLDVNGSAHLPVGTQDIGTGASTIMTQVTKRQVPTGGPHRL